MSTVEAGIWSGLLKAELPHSTWKNISVGGTRMYGEINSDARIALIPTGTNVIFTGGGHNDWAQNITLGSLSTLDNPATFAGAVNLCIQKYQTSFPDALLIFIADPFGIYPGKFTIDNIGILNNNGDSLYDFAEMMKTVCKYLGIICIDVYGNCGINYYNYSQNLKTETNIYSGYTGSLHPNEIGGRKILRVIRSWLRQIS
jgi:hypothetical protein